MDFLVTHTHIAHFNLWTACTCAICQNTNRNDREFSGVTRTIYLFILLLNSTKESLDNRTNKTLSLYISSLPFRMALPVNILQAWLAVGDLISVRKKLRDGSCNRERLLQCVRVVFLPIFPQHCGSPTRIVPSWLYDWLCWLW